MFKNAIMTFLLALQGNWFCECDPCYGGAECNTLCNNIGNCTNNTCQCGDYSGFRGPLCEVESCPGVGEDCSGQQRGECLATKPKKKCACYPGYVGVGCEHISCERNCSDVGDCSINPDHSVSCKCWDPYFGDICDKKCENGKVDNGTCVCDPCYSGQTCSLECTGNGQCNNGICLCNQGWGLTLCDKETCPGIGVECSGRGVCIGVNCSCIANWVGPGCEIPQCDEDCNNHGTCKGDTRIPYCSCDQGWMGRTCKDRCYGMTDPNDPNACECNNCTHGLSCESTCGGVGVCLNNGSGCDCNNQTTGLNDGFWGDKCTDRSCPGVGGTICNGKGSCTQSVVNGEKFYSCQCDANFDGAACEQFFCTNPNANPGDPECNGNGRCELENGNPTCKCNDTYLGTFCQLQCFGGTIKVDSNGNEICECHPCYSGATCDKLCGGQGNCTTKINSTDPTQNITECACEINWKGDYCTEKTCWGLFNLECSGRGNCDYNNQRCKSCNQGWTGDYCEFPNCDDGNPDCSGRGVCDVNTLDSVGRPTCVNCTLSMGKACEDDCIHGTEKKLGTGSICECDTCYSGELAWEKGHSYFTHLSILFTVKPVNKDWQWLHLKMVLVNRQSL